MSDTLRYKGVDYVKTANFELDNEIACSNHDLSQAEQKFMTINGKRGYVKKDTDNFLELCRKYGIYEGRVFDTIYGKLKIGSVNGCERMFTIFTRFQSVDKLPGKQVPYQFATPETHQTYSLGDSIYGWSFNGYSGKWNFHFSYSYEWHPAGALCEFLKALDSIWIKEEEAA